MLLEDFDPVRVDDDILTGGGKGHGHGQQGSENRAGHGNGGVAPVTVTLAGDRQQCVSNPRAEISCGVDRITGRASLL